MPDDEASILSEGEQRAVAAGMRTVWVLALGSFATGSGLLVVAGIVPRIATDLRGIAKARRPYAVYRAKVAQVLAKLPAAQRALGA